MAPISPILMTGTFIVAKYELALCASVNQCTNYSFVKENKDCKPNYCSLLRIKCITKSDAGNYTCRFQTDEDTYDSVDHFWLDVHGKTINTRIFDLEKRVVMCFHIFIL